MYTITMITYTTNKWNKCKKIPKIPRINVITIIANMDEIKLLKNIAAIPAALINALIIIIKQQQKLFSLLKYIIITPL